MKYIFSLLLLLVTTFSFSQSNEGRIRYLVVHNWAKKMASVDYISQQEKDRVSYMWGNRSEWKSYSELFYSGQKTKFQNSEESAEDDDYGYSWRKEMYFQTRDFENNTILDGIYTLGKNYIIEDSLWTQDWKILNDMKEVAGHICMNAQWVDTLKQQTVIAWFALDIPLSGGPDKYCGLPGMILEIDINNGAMVISADLIEEKTVDQEMELPKKLKGKHVSQAEYDAIIKQHIEDKRKAKEPYFWGIRY